MRVVLIVGDTGRFESLALIPGDNQRTGFYMPPAYRYQLSLNILHSLRKCFFLLGYSFDCALLNRTRELRRGLSQLTPQPDIKTAWGVLPFLVISGGFFHEESPQPYCI